GTPAGRRSACVRGGRPDGGPAGATGRASAPGSGRSARGGAGNRSRKLAFSWSAQYYKVEIRSEGERIMLWLFAAAALLAQAPANGTITFESSLELETVVRDGKPGDTTKFLTLNRKEKFRQTKVDAKTVKIECLSSSLQKSGSDFPIEEKPTALN